MSKLGLYFFFNDTATTEIYTLSLHDALPISHEQVPTTCVGPIPSDKLIPRHFVDTGRQVAGVRIEWRDHRAMVLKERRPDNVRSEEHTSELQSRQYLVCRLLPEKKTTTHTAM